MLASALTKLLWMNNLTPQNHQTLTLVARHHGNQAQVFAVAAQQMSEDADLVNGVNFLSIKWSIDFYHSFYTFCP